MLRAQFSPKSLRRVIISWTVAKRLALLNIIIISFALIGMGITLEIQKTSRLNELNFLHTKYTYQLGAALMQVKDDEPNLENLRLIIENIRQQPIDCLKIVGPIERIIMRAVGSYEAIQLCVQDLATADRALATLNFYTEGELDTPELRATLDQAAIEFSSNSEQFAPLVHVTLEFIFSIMTIIFCILAFGMPVFVYVILDSVKKDYNRLSKAESSVRHARREAEQASRTKSEFLANMSHELRTPMNGIIGMAEILLREGLPPSAQEKVQAIKTSSRNLLAILNDILDLSKVEAGRLTLEKRAFYPARLLEEIKPIWTEASSARGLLFQLQNDLPSNLVAEGDDNRIRQILNNLLSNAVKFTDHGNITLRAFVVEANTTQVDLRFEVKDTGIGIAIDQQAAIFEKFTQADQSITRRFGGTGLGLSICRQFIELMSGKMGLDSKVGQGSTFWFTTTLALTDATKVRSVATAENDQGTFIHLPKRILVAEDNPVNRMLVEAILKQQGIIGHFVEDGKAAVEAVQSMPFDMILMDDHMPHMDGVSATKAIRALVSNVTAQIPIIMLTANAMKGDRERYLRYGLNGYVPKPIDIDELIREIQHVMQKVQSKAA